MYPPRAATGIPGERRQVLHSGGRTFRRMEVPMVRQPDETRRALLDSAFWLFYEHGYQAAGLDAILGRAGVTKGALYHHFPGKKQLGLAVIDEVIHAWMNEHWIEPLSRPGDPIDLLLATVHSALERAGDDALRLGCPLNNIAQEMSATDEDFRARIEAIFSEWRATIAAALERGQTAGQVRRDADPAATAAFLVAAFEGGISTIKSSQSMALARTLMRGLEAYLDGLRTGATHGSRSQAPRRRPAGVHGRRRNTR
jgi:TetR/AcrR family transcriptional repressor of nem operon